MVGVIIGIIGTVVVAYMIIKKYKPQAVLLIGGIFMMIVSVLLKTGDIVDPKKSAGFWLVDIFDYLRLTFGKDLGPTGIGLIIMTVTGFSAYMDHIGASKAMVNLCIVPVKKLNKPYLLLALSYILGQFLNIFIPSASGLGVLMMATLFPILVAAGVSRLAAVSVIATQACLDLGPASGASNLAAKTAEIEPMVYFIKYQMPVTIPIVLSIAILHYIVEKRADKKSGYVLGSDVALSKDDGVTPPAVYTILPIIPLLLLFVFSSFLIKSIKIDVITAMFLSFALAIIFEIIRYKGKAKNVFKDMQVFFNAMGSGFATVVTLVVAGEVFAYSLQTLGAIDYMIKACESIGFGPMAMTVIMVIFIMLISVVMGSGNAAFFAFAALSPTIAASFGTSTVLIAMPLQLASGIARCISPISGVVIAVSGIGGVSNMDVVKRTWLPMLGGTIALLVTDFIVFGGAH